MDVVVIDTADLGDRSYVVSDGAVAAVIDPQRDVERVLREVEARGLRVTHVFETHIHNDYVTGGLSDGEVAGARRALARIGYDTVAGRAAPVPDDGGVVTSYRVADFAALAKELERPDVVVLDVRRDDEWDAGHLRSAVHVHLPELPDRLGEVPGGEAWVHCASGFRASIAASLLDRAGRAVVMVDDEWERVQDTGLDVTTPAGR